MFPVLSYIFLGGKCRYCKNKISPRYLILEVLSGLVFVGIFSLLRFDIYNLTINNLIQFGFIALAISYLFITVWIYIENKKIMKSVNIYGICVAILYIVYLCILRFA